MHLTRNGVWVLILYLRGQVFADLTECPLLSEIENGYYEQISDFKVKVVCDDGYNLFGKQILRCSEGKWSSSYSPNCLPPENECSPPPKLDNGKIISSGKAIGTTIIYECDKDFFMIGENKRTCTEQLYWSGVPPYCHPKDRKPEEMVEMLKHHLDANITAMKATGPHGRILGPEIYERGLDLFFLIDRSSSVDPIDLQSAKKFIIKLVKIFKGNENRTHGTRVCVISFGSEAKVEIDLTNDTYNSVNVTTNRIEQIKDEGGGTAMQPAVNLVFHFLSALRKNAKKALFLLTDGEPNVYDSEVEPEHLAVNLKKLGFEIYCIGVGKDISSERLIKIASEPPINHVFMLEKYQKFDEVLDYIQKPLTTTPAPPPPGPDACGYLGDSQSEARYETKSRQHPWMAAIYHFPNHKKNGQARFCSGVVISDQWVLTSGFCVQQHVRRTSTKDHIAVVLGTESLLSNGNLNFYAVKYVISPLESPGQLPELRLALIKLDRQIPMNGAIRPICLRDPNAYDSLTYHNSTIEGWGSMASTKDDKKLHVTASYVSLISHRIKVREFNLEQNCKMFLIRNYNRHQNETGFQVRHMSDKFLCVGNREGMSAVRRRPSVCAGNYGSPLVIKDNKTQRYTLLGIQSSRHGCLDVKSYFLLIRSYTSWVEKTTGVTIQL